jgi:hypothetical protein
MDQLTYEHFARGCIKVSVWIAKHPVVVTERDYGIRCIAAMQRVSYCLV